MIKEDLPRVFLEFHIIKGINQSTNTTFIALVLKKRQTDKISNLRLISLVTSLYKTIVKLFLGMSKELLLRGDKFIVNQMVDEKRHSGDKGTVLKIDFEKVYNHVD